jgi:hypothetical protein
MQDQAKPDTLSAQQFQNLQKQYVDELKKISHRMELRDRALDQAIKVTTASLGGPAVEGKVILHPMTLAQEMFEFLTADLPPAVHPSPDRQTPA